MQGNLTPWLVLGAAIAVTLYLKGYLKVPTGLIGPPTVRVIGPTQQPTDYVGKMVAEKFDSRTLGLMFARAMHAEAQEKLATDFAIKAGEDLLNQFTAPFSPAPATPSGPSQNQAGVSPPA